MAHPLQLEGIAHVEDDGLQGQWRRERSQLEDELRRLRHELKEAQAENEKLKRSVKAIQKPLSGIYHGLRALFGEIEFAVGAEQFNEPAPGTTAPQTANIADPKWESYKRNFAGVGAEIIDALLAHGQMKMSHIASLIKRDRGTVASSLTKLKNAGAVVGERGADGGWRLRS